MPEATTQNTQDQLTKLLGQLQFQLPSQVQSQFPIALPLQLPVNVLLQLQQQRPGQTGQAEQTEQAPTPQQPNLQMPIVAPPTIPNLPALTEPQQFMPQLIPPTYQGPRWIQAQPAPFTGQLPLTGVTEVPMIPALSGPRFAPPQVDWSKLGQQGQDIASLLPQLLSALGMAGYGQQLGDVVGEITRQMMSMYSDILSRVFGGMTGGQPPTGVQPPYGVQLPSGGQPLTGMQPPRGGGPFGFEEVSRGGGGAGPAQPTYPQGYGQPPIQLPQSLLNTLPQGGTWGYNPNTGGYTYTLPNGQTYEIRPAPNGWIEVWTPDGRVLTYPPHGTAPLIGEPVPRATAGDIFKLPQQVQTPDGRTITLPLGVTLPPGGQWVEDPEYGQAYKAPDGTTYFFLPDGSVAIKYPDGRTQIVPPSTITSRTPDTTPKPVVPNVVRTPDGRTITLPPGLTLPEGGQWIEDPEYGWAYKAPDGTTYFFLPDGSVSVRLPNGETRWIPAEGMQGAQLLPPGIPETGTTQPFVVGAQFGQQQRPEELYQRLKDAIFQHLWGVQTTGGTPDDALVGIYSIIGETVGKEVPQWVQNEIRDLIGRLIGSTLEPGAWGAWTQDMQGTERVADQIAHLVQTWLASPPEWQQPTPTPQVIPTNEFGFPVGVIEGGGQPPATQLPAVTQPRRTTPTPTPIQPTVPTPRVGMSPLDQYLQTRTQLAQILYGIGYTPEQAINLASGLTGLLSQYGGFSEDPAQRWNAYSYLISHLTHTVPYDERHRPVWDYFLTQMGVLPPQRTSVPVQLAKASLTRAYQPQTLLSYPPQHTLPYNVSQLTPTQAQSQLTNLFTQMGYPFDRATQFASTLTNMLRIYGGFSPNPVDRFNAYNALAGYLNYVLQSEPLDVYRVISDWIIRQTGAGGARV